MNAWLLGGLLAMLAFWAIGAYNRLVALRNAIVAAYQPVDEQLRRRDALLRTLLDQLLPALAREQATLDALGAALAQVQASAEAARARTCSARAVAALALAEGVLAAAQARALAAVEPLPELRAREDVSAALVQLHEVQLRLEFARQQFNDATAQYDRAVRQFPTSLLTRAFGFRSAGKL